VFTKLAMKHKCMCSESSLNVEKHTHGDFRASEFFLPIRWHIFDSRVYFSSALRFDYLSNICQVFMVIVFVYENIVPV